MTSTELLQDYIGLEWIDYADELSDSDIVRLLELELED